jgi:hypothetical protein
MTCGNSTVVDHPSQHPKVEDSSPDTAAGTGREKMQKIGSGLKKNSKWTRKEQAAPFGGFEK